MGAHTQQLLPCKNDVMTCFCGVEQAMTNPDLFYSLYSRRPLPDVADRIASDALPPASSMPGPHGQPLLSGLAGAMSDEQRELHYRRLRTRRMRDSVDRIYGVLAMDMDLRGVAEELDHLDLAIKMWRQEIETAAKGGAA